MKLHKSSLIGFALALCGADGAIAQQAPLVPANPTPGCTATQAQLEANKKLVLSFFTSQGADRVALADESYKQHNHAFKKRAENEKISDYEEFKKTFMA